MPTTIKIIFKTSSVIILIFGLCISQKALSGLKPLSDDVLSTLSGQLMVEPLVDLENEIFSKEILTGAHSTQIPLTVDAYQPLSSFQMAQQQGQGIRVIHTVFPTGARSPDPQIGNINLYGRDYRTGDNFDRVSDCFDTACGTGTAWDPDGDGIPGNSGGNANFIPAGDETPWAAGPDGHIDDFYYEYDYYAAYGANGTVPDSPEDWHFYRIETDALIKIVAKIRRVSMGGYGASYGGCGNAFEVVVDFEVLTNNGKCGHGFSNYSYTVPGTEGQEDEDSYRTNYTNSPGRVLDNTDRANYFNYDSEIRNITIGNLGCGGVSDARATFLNGNGAYRGHCENDERPFNPFVLKNPFTEIALAPECELFAEPGCNDPQANTNLVFAGYRSGFESVSGSGTLNQYSSTGSTNAVISSSSDITCNSGGISYGGDLGTNESVCEGYREFLDVFAADGLLLYGHRARGMAAMPKRLCVQGSFIGITIDACALTGTGGEGLLTNLSAQDLHGLWSSTVRNDFQWPGQGWAADDGLTTAPAAFRDTLADRDYAGVNTHIPAGATGHGGSVINNHTPPTLGIERTRAFTHVEIAL